MKSNVKYYKLFFLAVVKEPHPVEEASCALARTPRPRPEKKRVWASLEKIPQQVIEEALAEASHRDPAGEKNWVALVDGNRWSLTGAEAVLRLRALRSSHDFDRYWVFHEAREYERNHQTLYASGIVPPTAASLPACKREHLKIIK